MYYKLIEQMNDNSQNTRAVVMILGILAAIVLVVCSGVGLAGYAFVTQFSQTQKLEAEQHRAEAAQHAAVIREQQLRQ